MEYRHRIFKNKSNKNTDYKETIRGKCWDLKDYGIPYKVMSEESGVGYSTIRNFACCYRDTMRKDNWEKFSPYIEEKWDLIIDSKRRKDAKGDEKDEGDNNSKDDRRYIPYVGKTQLGIVDKEFLRDKKQDDLLYGYIRINTLWHAGEDYYYCYKDILAPSKFNKYFKENGERPYSISKLTFASHLKLLEEKGWIY